VLSRLHVYGATCHSHTKAIEMSFDVVGRMGPENAVLDGVQISTQWGAILGMGYGAA